MTADRDPFACSAAGVVLMVRGGSGEMGRGRTLGAGGRSTDRVAGGVLDRILQSPAVVQGLTQCVLALHAQGRWWFGRRCPRRC